MERLGLYTPGMHSGEVFDLFRQCGALLEGHFVLSSGLHTSGYLQCARVLQYPKHAAIVGAALAQRLIDYKPAVVLSPALGGLIIGHEVARACGVRALFAERKERELVLRRGFSVEPGERVLVVEDVITTGGSTRETMEVAQQAGGEVIAVAAIINRGGADISFGVPFRVLADVSWPTHEPADCPLCLQGIPFSKPGSR